VLKPFFFFFVHMVIKIIIKVNNEGFKNIK